MKFGVVIAGFASRPWIALAKKKRRSMKFGVVIAGNQVGPQPQRVLVRRSMKFGVVIAGGEQLDADNPK